MYALTRTKEVKEITGECGPVKELASSHDINIAQIRIDGETPRHRHDKCTEFYYIVEGSLKVELGTKTETMSKSDALTIHPGTEHKAIGKAVVLAICSPPWTPDDEIITEQ